MRCGQKQNMTSSDDRSGYAGRSEQKGLSPSNLSDTIVEGILPHRGLLMAWMETLNTHLLRGTQNDDAREMADLWEVFVFCVCRWGRSVFDSSLAIDSERIDGGRAGGGICQLVGSVL